MPTHCFNFLFWAWVTSRPRGSRLMIIKTLAMYILFWLDLHARIWKKVPLKIIFLDLDYWIIHSESIRIMIRISTVFPVVFRL